MKPTSSPSRAPDPREALGQLLVALQFGLCALLAAAALPRFLEAEVSWMAWGLALLGAGLAGWTLQCNRPGNFHIRPTPRAGARLVRHGPYQWFRHPMYIAVLLFAAAAAWSTGSALAWLACAALLAVLRQKARLEERWMTDEHPDYRDYMQVTRGFW